ncbi:MAG: OmpA family protein [Flavobacteriales bacterium]|nr:OmpA family protein [Flavobacteriales bacterium]
MRNLGISASLLMLSITLLLGSCATHVPCGVPVDKVKGNKKYKAAVAERDSLCIRTKALEDEVGLGLEREKGLNEDLTEQQKRYDDLTRLAGEEVAGLSDNLKKKEGLLAEKEQLLKDREARLKVLEDIVKKQDDLMNALSDRIKQALLGFAADELSVEMRNGKVYVSMSDKLLFRSGSDAVEVKGKEALAKLAEALQRNADISIQIEGHTDSIPINTARFRDNWDLSAARSTSVVRLLTTGTGMDPERLTASGKGEFNPIAPNRTPEGRAKNRRTEIILSPKLDILMELLGK